MNYHSYSNQLCDTIIEVEGTHFHAHKSVLCELSPYFSALFTRWSSPGQFMYTVPGVTPKIMKAIIQYGYSQRIRITRKNVQALLEAADYLLMDDIVHLCCQFLVKRLCSKNCIEMLRLATAHSWHELRDRASLMVKQSQIYCQLRSKSPGVGDRSGRRRQTPYTLRHSSINGAWNFHPTQITPTYTHTIFFLFLLSLLLVAVINTHLNY
ncbi:kelch-like protein 10 [Ictalurus punctatus]|uniref:Kelch-like protein 10 n=1 Tax=Ictalurus punctatus TaxID=7998 RepID=A0A2D0QEB5_ICTPU|nr:kelch-like protein 10 [Ictalurus punctatus]